MIHLPDRASSSFLSSARAVVHTRASRPRPSRACRMFRTPLLIGAPAAKIGGVPPIAKEVRVAILETARLVLSPLRAEDLAELCALFADVAAMRYHEGGRARTPEQTRERLTA